MGDHQAQAQTQVRPRRPSTRRDFEIAIICALIHEADAVEALFDHHWEDDGPPYDKAPGDPNAYSTGVIGRHNVVIAYMPGMGKANAAALAAHCQASFPGIRLALVVGICGVVPTDRDGQEIVLGDVIISDGIIQYDFGRRLPERFERKDTLLDSLGRPNTEIRSLLAKLKGFRGRKTLQAKSLRYLAIIQQEPALGAQYPGVNSDQLFDATYRHVADGKLCDDCGCVGPLKQRSRLGDDSPPPLVHFGLIASGDTVLKSGEDRDALAQEEEVIAFEMESAGVWDIFPCVVIKGACDYADSHKMKAWQHYAAATAAACMKSFLDSWVPSTAPPPEAHTSPENTTGPSSRVVMLPFLRNLNFTGRETILKALEESMFVSQTCRTLAIVGLGGVGKTQVVLQFAYWVKENQPDYSVFWVPAYSEESFEQAYMEIARKMGILVDPNKKDHKSAIHSHLSSEEAGKWVLIVDNADDEGVVLQSPRGLCNYLPKSDAGLTIVTTRSPDVAVSVAGGNNIHLEEMGMRDATNLLRTSLSRKHLLGDPRMTTELLHELTCLPLAITQAASYLNRNRHVSLQRYLKLIRGTEQDMTSLLSREFEDSTRYRGSRNSVATTWIVSFNQIQKTDAAAAQLLSFICCIEPKAIPRSLLPTLGSEESMEHTIGTLSGYSFLVSREEEDVYDMHRLVHLATRVWLKLEGRIHKATTEAVQHVYRLRLLNENEGLEIKEKYMLAFKVGSWLRQSRRARLAVPFLEPASNWYAEQSEENPKERLIADHWLASIYIDCGRDHEAIQKLEPLVQLGRTIFDEKDGFVLHCQHELARAYSDTDQTENAIEIFEHVMKLRSELAFETDHDRMVTEFGLGWAYFRDKRIQDAIKVLEHLVKVQRTVNNERDHFRLTSEYCLGDAYIANGQIKEALQIMESVVERKRLLSDDQEMGRLSWSEYVLAGAYLKDKQNQKAIDLLECTVRLKTRRNGRDSLILWLERRLSVAYLANGQRQMAVDMRERASTRPGRLDSNSSNLGKWSRPLELTCKELEEE
ncbi:hypothetical protein PG991_008207 [Apiospora marii]|uniref:Nucleoside phosphorylase domain-containing protein n=1 Tax=Apiospora marii TaxID=335849 RepID=A0ABR1RQ96_9PEZI